jgi:hypothetical protein
MDARFDALLGVMEGGFDRVESRFDRVDARFDALEARIDTHLGRHAG